MAISAVRLMSLIAEAVKSPPQAKADPSRTALVKGLVAPPLPAGSTAGTVSAPPTMPPLQAMRMQQAGSAAVLQAYGVSGAVGSADGGAEEAVFGHPPGRAGAGVSDPLPRADLPPAGPRVIDASIQNRLNPLPIHGFTILPSAGQVDAMVAKASKVSAEKPLPRGAQVEMAEASVQKMPLGLIVTASAVVTVMMLALILAL